MAVLENHTFSVYANHPVELKVWGAQVEQSNNRIRAEKAEAALRRIERWFGEFPPSGRHYDDGTEMSYGAAFGSNGERDFMRKVARDALDGKV